MRILASITLCALMLIAAVPAGAEETDASPWIGKTRGEVVSMLGKPDSAKGRGKRERLVYRFVRVGDEKALPPGIELIAVPGVEGSVGRMYRAESAAVAIAGTQIDARGRLTGGDNVGEESRDISWSKNDGKRVTQSSDDRSAVTGKCTIKFKLSGGRVTEWSVSSVANGKGRKK